MIRKDINNIVWLIPIRKVRDSLRNYMIKLIKDNEFIKLQNKYGREYNIYTLANKNNFGYSQGF